LQAECFHQMWRGWCYVLLMLLYKQEFHLKGLLMLPKDTRIHVNAIQVRIHLDAIQMLLLGKKTCECSTDPAVGPKPMWMHNANAAGGQEWTPVNA
jgi:hypothetical protein